MNAPDRQLRIKKLFSEALLKEEAERLDWLKRQCGEDEQLLEEILSLLQHAASDADPLEDGLNIRQNMASGNRGEPAFHVQCPHCHNPIELIAEQDPLAEVNCSSCGSSFKLLQAEDTRTWHPDHEDRIGRFQLAEKIGFGSFGSVYRAFDESLDRTVAVKIPRRDQLTATEAELFLREARATAQLRHPNIVSLHEVGIEDDTIYLVSDFIDGLTVGDWLTGHRPDAREAVQLCLVLARALDHAHERGVIHRDLKPSNIMLDREQTPFLMDFGLAKRDAGEMTMTLDGQVIGTPAYMSPEQASGSGHTVDRRTDIYSLGVIFFELLTGERPFRGNTQMLIHQVQTEEAPSPRKFNATIPRDLETICQRCLEKDPDRRFKTASDLADELERWLSGTPILTRPVSPVERGWRWCLRHPMVATLSFLLLFTLTAGIAVSSWFAFQERERSRQLANSNSELEETNENLTEAHRQQRLARYVGDMSVIGMAWESENLTLVNRILERNRPQDGVTDLRGFEWYYWHRLANLHVGQVNTDARRGFAAARFSPDGASIYLLDADGRTRAWNLDSDSEEHFSFRSSLDPHTLWVTYTAFDPVFELSGDGKSLMTLSETSELVIRDTKTGNRKFSIGKDSYSGAVFAPDDTEIITGSFGQKIQIHDVRTKRVKKTLGNAPGDSTSLRFSPMSRVLLAVRRQWEPFGGWENNGVESITAWFYGSHEPAFAIDKHGTVSSQLAEGTTNFEFPPPTKQNNLFLFNDQKEGNLIAVEFLGSERLMLWGDDGYLYQLALDGEQAPRIDEFLLKVQAPVTEGVLDPRRWKMAATSDGAMFLFLEGRSVKVKQGEHLPSPSVTTLRHNTEVVDFKISRDNGVVVTCGRDGEAKLWDLEMPIPEWSSLLVDSEKELFRSVRAASLLSLTLDLAETLRFSPCGSRLAVTDTEGFLRVYSTEDLSLEYTITDHGPSHEGFDAPANAFQSLVVSPDGKQVVGEIVGTPGLIVCLDPVSGREIDTFQMKSEIADSKKLSPNKKLAAIYNGQDVELIDTVSGEVRAILQHKDLLAETLEFSSDSGSLAAMGKTGEVYIWDTDSGILKSAIRDLSSKVPDLRFCSNGNRVVTRGKNGVAVWDVQTAKKIAQLQKPDVHQIEVDALGTYISVAFGNLSDELPGFGGAANAIIWDTKTNAEIPVANPDNAYMVRAFRQDGQQYIGSALWHSFAVYDTISGRKLFDLPQSFGELKSAAWSHDQSHIIASVGPGGHSLLVWDAKTGKVVNEHKRHEGVIVDWVYDYPRLSSAFSPDGKFLATASADGSIALRNAATGKRLKTCTGHEGSVISIEFFSDNERVVTGGADGTARIWDVSSGELLTTFSEHHGYVESVAVSPDCSYVATSVEPEDVVRIWRVATGELLFEISELDDKPLFEGGDICRLCFSKDSKTLLMGTDTNDVLSCDLASGIVTRLLSSHTASARIATLSSDGTRVITASDDNTIRIWDTESGSLMLTLREEVDASDADHIEITADGTRIAVSGVGMGDAMIIDVRSDTQDRRRCVQLESRCWRAEQLIDSQPAKAMQLMQDVLDEVDARLTNPPETGTWEKLLLPGRYQELKERCKSGIESIESKNRQAIH